MKRITILDNEAYLRQQSKEVDFNNQNYLKDIATLKEYCANNAVFAMAAIQLGIPKKIIYLKNTTSDIDKNNDANYDEAKVLINPIIKNKKGKTKFLESCESCPAYIDKNDKDKSKYLSAVIERPYSIEVEYYDENGDKHYDLFEDFEATVISHEYDHLNGILHIDLANEIFSFDLTERTAYRKEHPYEIISKK